MTRMPHQSVVRPHSRHRTSEIRGQAINVCFSSSWITRVRSKHSQGKCALHLWGRVKLHYFITSSESETTNTATTICPVLLWGSSPGDEVPWTDEHFTPFVLIIFAPLYKENNDTEIWIETKSNSLNKKHFFNAVLKSPKGALFIFLLIRVLDIPPGFCQRLHQYSRAV